AEALQECSGVVTRTLDQQLLWLLDKLDHTAGFVSTVHSRMTISTTIHVRHERFHQMLEALMVSQLALHGLPEAARVPAARIAMFVMEGLLSHHAADPVQRDTVAATPVSRFRPAD